MMHRLLLTVSVIFFVTVHAVVRLKVDGSSLLDPTNNDKEIVLRGFNWYIPYIVEEDADIMQSLLPETNVVRLVALFWDNWHPTDTYHTDCRINNASLGYIRPSCLTTMDTIINNIIKHKIWVIIVGKGQYAAGGDYPTYTDLFHNETLRNEYYTMWKYVANHYKNTDYIAGYEILTEPRTKIVSQSVVRDFYEKAIGNITLVDDKTPMIIGPAPFYDVWMLNNTLLIPKNISKNIIYTVDFYVPIDYIQSNGTVGNNYTYPGYYECKVATPGWSCQARHNVNPCFCGDDPNELIYIYKTWLVDLLLNNPINLRTKYNVPVFVNQWGIHKNVPKKEGHFLYTQDMLDIFIEYKIHATQWVWKWQSTNGVWHAYELTHNFTTNGSYIIDKNMIDIINKTWNDNKLN